MARHSASVTRAPDSRPVRLKPRDQPEHRFCQPSAKRRELVLNADGALLIGRDTRALNSQLRTRPRTLFYDTRGARTPNKRLQRTVRCAAHC
jgi:hypothetical protein